MPLDAQAQELLAKRAAMGAPPIESMPVESARQVYAVVARQAQVHSVEDHVVDTPDAAVAVRAYRPSADGQRPLVLFLHGGGWTLASVDVYDPLCRELAERSGCVVVAVDFRLAPEDPYPAALDDADAALSWAVEHAAELGATADAVAVMGDSAGGNLAASLALRARDRGGPHVDLQVLIYPMVDHATGRPSSVEFATGHLLERSAVDWFLGHYTGGRDLLDDPYVLPGRAPDLRGLPRTVLITAECDPLRDDAEAYGQALEQAGVEVSQRRYVGTFHGFFHMTGLLDQAAAAMDDVAGVLQQALRRP